MEATKNKKEKELLDKLLLEKFEPLAIVGISLKFPGHNNDLASFAKFLDGGQDGTDAIPSSRWQNNEYYTKDEAGPGKNCTNRGGYIDDFDKFDAKFFAVSPKEAENMDPQQRIMLQLVWEALEQASINPLDLKGGNGSVYIGSSTLDFAKELVNIEDKELESYMATGAANSAIPGRISYFLGMRGPSLLVDTACSSSLVSLHLAQQALRSRETDIALCGAINIVHYHANHVIFSQAGMLSPDGRCKTFDESADGYGRSEGAAVLVLKRLSDAVRDKNNILALLRGSAVLQDGESAGLTVPNGHAQEQVMRKALQNSLCKPQDINYVEAHGTGTPLGDPIEIQAINQVFATNITEPMPVASVKTNIGHMEATSGMGGIIKTVLQMQNNCIYPHINLTKPSQHIPWNDLKVDVPLQTQKWQVKKQRAIVNSFGFAGTIASAVLEEAPVTKQPQASEDLAGNIITIAAKDANAHKILLEKYLTIIQELPESGLGALCKKLNVGRAHFNYRFACVVTEKSKLITNIERALNNYDNYMAKFAEFKANQIAFLYTGQGSQNPGMGKELYAIYPTFKAAVDECDALFIKYINKSIKSIMFAEEDNSAELLQQTLYTQPALFSLEYALTKLWQSFGITPDLLLGHSIGEVIAACIAGVFSLQDAIKLVYYRASLMQSIKSDGSMLAVNASYTDIAELVAVSAVELAGINNPNQCVLAGDSKQISILADDLHAKNIQSTRLQVSHAFHSQHMQPILEEFTKAISDIEFKPPQIPFISNVTGKLALASKIMQAEYWAEQIRSTVNFVGGLHSLDELGQHTLIELGPKPHLLAFAKQTLPNTKHLMLASIKSREKSEQQILKVVQDLYLSGAQLNWHALSASDTQQENLNLPLYPFVKKRYWLTAKPKSSAGILSHPVLGKLTKSTSESWQYTALCTADTADFIKDHVVMDKIIFPAAGYIEMVIALQDQIFGQTNLRIHDFYIGEPLIFTDTEIELHTICYKINSTEYSFEINSDNASVKRQHASGKLIREADTLPTLEIKPESLNELAKFNHQELYKRLLAKGLAYKDAFKKAKSVTKYADDIVQATISHQIDNQSIFLSPAILDAVFNSIDVLLSEDKLYLPVGVSEFEFYKKPRTELTSFVSLHAATDKTGRYDFLADVELQDEYGLVLAINGLRLKTASTVNLQKKELLYKQVWLPKPLKAHKNQQSKVIFYAKHAKFSKDIHSLLDASSLDIHFANEMQDLTQMLVQEKFTKLVYFWQATNDSIQEEAELNFTSILQLLKILDENTVDLELTFVTTTAQVLAEDNTQKERTHNLIQSTLHGLQKVLVNERPKTLTRIIDFDSLPASNLTNMQMLLKDLVCNEQNIHHQVCYRDKNRYIAELTANDYKEENFALEIAEYGTFAGIERQLKPIPKPGPTEIIVRVEAAGLNFKDVINSLGLLKEHALQTATEYKELPLGFECSGVVVQVNPESHFKVGDEVIVSHLGCMQRYIKVNQKCVVHKPKNLTFADAAALPTAYITAYHALHTLADLKPHDKILIHAAAGGVGQAAIQLCKRIGAEVIGSASLPKWSFLKEQGLTKLINSRQAVFAEKIKQLTTGNGVDVVLNSFNKEFIPEGLKSLSENGRFVELGKVDILSHSQVAELRSDVEYFNFDLSELDPEKLNALNHDILTKIVTYIENEQISALPTTVYNITEIEDAFTVLSRGENVGKIVINFNEDRVVRNVQPQPITKEKLYLITGGMGALGRVAANWLVTNGAQNIALMSRSKVTEDVLNDYKQELNKSDINLLSVTGNTGDKDDIAKVFAEIKATGKELGGVFHTAGIIKDAPISSLTWQHFAELFQAKVYGSLLINQFIQDQAPQAFFVGYSSVAVTVGSVGQANYAAANSFIDQLMLHNQLNAQHGLSINWGPWSEVGMAAQLDNKQLQSIEKKGVKYISPSDAMQAFAKVFSAGDSQSVVSEFNWAAFADNLQLANPYYLRLLPKQRLKSTQIDLEKLCSLPENALHTAIVKLIREQLANVLHFDSPDEIELDARFSDLGLDSLVSVEFKNTIEKYFQVSLKPTDVFDYPSIPNFANLLSSKIAKDTKDRKEPTKAKKSGKGYIKKLIDKVVT